MQQNLAQKLLLIGLSQEDLAQAEAQSAQSSISLLHALENLNKVPEAKLLDAFSVIFGVPVVNLDARDIPQAIISLIPKEITLKYRVLPIDKVGNNLILAMGNPLDLQVTETIRFKMGFFVKRVLASENRISEALSKYYGSVLDMESLEKFSEQNKKSTINESKQERVSIDLSSDPKDANSGGVVKLANQILLECSNRKASDIHIEPYETFFRVRLRVDGTLIEIARPPASYKIPLTARFKIMASLNISETRLPQDGAINIIIADKPVDFRVSCCPTIHGEKIVMRILDKSALQVDMIKLGFEGADLAKFKSSIAQPYGMVLVTGPTGSGKTTTLYSALAELNKVTDNIMTAEDPVEYNLEGINQVQMKSEIGMNFASALKSFLRQDPDVIMVGEIRDLETAEIGIKAALTGHMVLSTLHTNSAPETISRMINMGVEPFNLISALTCVVAQRLMRKICEKCKIVDTRVTPAVLQNMGMEAKLAQTVKSYVGKGCSACGNVGLKGRVAVHEVLRLTDPVREVIIKQSSAMELKRVAIEEGMRSLRQAGLSKLQMGIVSAAEVAEATMSDGVEHGDLGDVA